MAGLEPQLGANALHSDQILFNTLFALVQVVIGFALLYRPTVKHALLDSFAWAFVVWWFGEAFGMLFMNMANQLTGAPGAVILYALIGAIRLAVRESGWAARRPRRAADAGRPLVADGVLLDVPAEQQPARGHEPRQRGASGMSWLSTIQNAVANARRVTALRSRS